LNGEQIENESLIEGRRIARLDNALALVPASTLPEDFIYFLTECGIHLVCRRVESDEGGLNACEALHKRLRDEELDRRVRYKHCSQRSVEHVTLIGECFLEDAMYGINNPCFTKEAAVLAIH
jgi:hypothetical protein